MRSTSRLSQPTAPSPPRLSSPFFSPSPSPSPQPLPPPPPTATATATAEARRGEVRRGGVCFRLFFLLLLLLNARGRGLSRPRPKFLSGKSRLSASLATTSEVVTSFRLSPPGSGRASHLSRQWCCRLPRRVQVPVRPGEVPARPPSSCLSPSSLFAVPFLLGSVTRRSHTKCASLPSYCHKE